MSSIFSHETISLGLFSGFASRQANDEAKSPSKWIENVTQALGRTFPNLNYIIYDEETIDLKKDRLEGVISNELFIVGEFDYNLLLFEGGSVELPKKYLDSNFFAYGGPNKVKIEAISKPRKVLKFFTWNSTSLKLTFERDDRLTRTEIFEKAYLHVKERTPKLDELVKKAEENHLETMQKIQARLKNNVVLNQEVSKT